MEEFWTKVKKFFRRVLIWGTLIGFVVVAGYFSFVRVASYSNGFRVGKVIKFSHKGKLIKTYEGELNLGGFRSEGDGGVVANAWEFSVYPGDEEIRKEIERAAERGYTVKLHYKEKYAQVVFWGDTKYFIYDVERVRPEGDEEDEE